jgi:hypothetical protein
MWIAKHAVALVLAGLSGPQATHNLKAEAVARSHFPLMVSPSQRYLIDQERKPFLVNGDAAWSLLVQLNLEEADLYLADRQAKGFNTILVNLLEHKFADRPPKNRRGDPPFLGALPFTRPNPRYFDFAEEVIRRAGSKGMCVFLCPAYLGSQGGDEGWFQEIKKAGRDVLRAYGRYVGNRFRSLPNIVWVAGGDYTPKKTDQWTIDELAEGLRSSDPGHLITCHAGGISAAEEFGDRKWLDLNTTYSYHAPLYLNLLADFRRSPVRPFIMIESTYENEHNAKPEQIRRQAYWSLLCGGAGHFFGNNPIWTFDSPVKVFPTNVRWKHALDTQGAQDMARLWKLFSARPWPELEPDVDHKLVTDGYGKWDTEAFIMAARTHDGRLALAYVASSAPNRFTVDLTQLAGSTLASWYNPVNGQYRHMAGEPFPSAGKRTFQTPGDNGSGARDWILVLEAGKSISRSKEASR